MISFPFNSRPDCSGQKLNGEDGFPHSEIVGSKVAHTSPTLIAACHVLHRLCMPRHPPNALTSRLRVHTTNDKADPPATFACAWSSGYGLVAMLQINLLSIVINLRQRRTSSDKKKIAPPRHRFLEPIYNVKDGGKSPVSGWAGKACLHSWRNFPFSTSN